MRFIKFTSGERIPQAKNMDPRVYEEAQHEVQITTYAVYLSHRARSGKVIQSCEYGLQRPKRFPAHRVNSVHAGDVDGKSRDYCDQTAARLGVDQKRGHASANTRVALH